jgi:N-acetylneuraminic acid mutarotase
MQEVAPMSDSRSSFGCTVNVHKKEIYVAGGYTKALTTKKCEAYNVDSNEWRPLPSLNEEKCASSLSLLGGHLLYCFGGFNKNEQSQALLLNTIEVCDLNCANEWQTLSMKLPQQVCDMGSVPISKNKILLFGGWLKTASQHAYMLTRHGENEHSISEV